MKTLFQRPLTQAGIATGLGLIATQAQAHPGAHAMHQWMADSSTQLGAFLMGLSHPFSGWDHWAAALLVGLWSIRALPQGKVWLAPALFVAMLAAGSGLGLALGAQHTLVSLIEPMIITSIASLAVLALLPRLLAVRLQLFSVLPLVGVFAVFHGMAHGRELATLGEPGLSTLGAVLGTATLHGVGVWLGSKLPANRVADRLSKRKI